MAEYVYDASQGVALNNPLMFNDSIPCTRGYIIHDDGTGVLILRGIVNNQCAKYATYRVTYNGNISIPTGGTVTPIAVAIAINGEPKKTSRAIFTPAAVEEFGNVTSTAIVRVPKDCCFNISIDYVPGTDDPTVTPTPLINVIDSNLVITRTA